MTQHDSSNRPVRALTAAGLCLALLGVLVSQTFGPFDWLGAPKAAAVGGYDAVNVLGPGNFTGEGTWEFLFFPAEAFLEFAYQFTEAEVIWAVTDGSIYYCDTGTLCDEETDWVSYAMSDSLTSIAIDQDITHVVLYVGTAAATAEILRCDVGLTGCDAESDWTSAFAVDLTGVTDNTDALISAGGFMFAGVHANSSSGPTTVFRCDIAGTDCDDTADWFESDSSHGGTARQFLFDEANDDLYLGERDSSGTGHLRRCGDLASSGCDDSGDWDGVYGQSLTFNGITKDEVNEVIYLAFNASGEGGDEPGAVVRCETATGCDAPGDFDELDTTGTDAESIIWEPVNGFLFTSDNGDLYRCDTADLCDDFADFELVSTSAGQTRFVIDPVNSALFSGGDALYRCELSTGCGAGNELDGPLGVAHDEAGQRLFVSDNLHSRVLVYDLSDGLDDGEEPVNVLGQIDFFEVNCNDSAGPGSPQDYTLCQPAELAYDATNDRLFVGDFSNNRVMVWDLSGPISDGMPASFVLGQPDFTTADCETDQTSLCETQSGIAYDSTNDRLFVGDLFNRRVMVFDVTTITNGEAAINVIGAPDYTTDPGSCSNNQSSTCTPFGVTLNGDDQVLFVADGGVHRVTTFNVDPSVLVPNDPGSDGPLAINVLGQSGFFGAGAGTSASTMTNPSGLSYDSAGNRLFVADSGNNRVLQFDTTTIDDGEEAVDVYGQDDLDSGGSGTTQSSLQSPYGLIYMPGDDLIAIADTTNDRIMFFEAQPNGGGGGGGGPTGGHEATDVIGQLMGDDTPTFDHRGVDNSPNSRGFSGPAGVVIDAVHHRLFEVDPGNHRVMVFDLDVNNQLIDHLADHVLGNLDFRANGNGTDQARMTYPQYAAYDAVGDRLFVSDYSNNRVMVFDVATIVDGENAINVLGQPDFDTNTVVLSDTGMSNPRGVAFDPTLNRLFVGSQDHQRVLVYDVTTITNGEAAINVLGQEDFTSAGSNLDQDGFGTANNLALDVAGERLFVDDSPFSRVMVFDVSSITNGEDAVNVIGQDDFTSGGSDLDQDSLDFSGIYGNGLAYDSDNGRLFVGDGSNRRVMVFDADPSVLIPNNASTDGPNAINVLGQSDFTSEDDSLSQSSTRAAGGLAYDEDNGLLYTTTVGDTGQPDPDNRSSVFDVNVIVNGEPAVDLLGQLDENDEPYYTARGVDNSPNAQGFAFPGGVVIDTTNHRAFVSDTNNHRILVFDLDTNNTIIDRTADAVLGQVDFKENECNQGGGTPDSDTLCAPASAAYDTSGNRLFVRDTENNRVLVFDVAAITDGEDAVNVLGQPDFTSDTSGVTTQDSLWIDAASGGNVAYDPTSQRLFVPDVNNNRVMVFDVATIVDGENAINVLGQDDFVTNGGSTTQSTFAGPGPSHAVYEDATNRLFVADTYNHRVMVFDVDPGVLVADTPSTDGPNAINVLGQDDFTSNTPATSQNGLSSPDAVTINQDESVLFVADVDNNRVMVFDVAAITDGEDGVDAYGQPDFSSSGCDVGIDKLCAPTALDYDEALETLYVVDGGNNRVLAFGPTPTGGGGGPQPTPEPVGFTPGRIIINRDDAETDSRNVLVSVYAQTTNNFTGVVDVLLSNTNDFSTFVPFRYVVPEILNNGNANRDIWPKTIAWDLCFGLTDTSSCSLGNKIVYARFYVNVPAPVPVLVPRPAVLNEHP